MSEESNPQETAVIPSNAGSLSGESSCLIQRGLQTLEKPTVTMEQIRTARNTIKEYRGLSDEAIRTALERPAGWEWLLFFQVLVSEISGYESLRQAVEFGFALNTGEKLEIHETMTWQHNRLQDALNFFYDIIKIMDEDYTIAVGPPGIPGKPDALILAARKFGLVYKNILDLSLRIIAVQRDSVFDGVFRETAKAINGLASQTEAYCSSSLVTIKEVLSAPRTDIKREIILNFTPQFNLDSVSIETEKMKKACIQRGWNWQVGP